MERRLGRERRRAFAGGGTSTGCGRSTSAQAPPQRLLGAAHGAVSNQLALLQASPLDDARDVAQMLERTAIVEGPLANWPTDDELPLEHKGRSACSGATAHRGSSPPRPRTSREELLLAGAELTWQAGPPQEGPGLCHGTAGNGYALLKAFERTGDELWLDRARRFAMHALEQVERRGRAATPSSPATSESRSTPPTASTPARASRFSTAGTSSPLLYRPEDFEPLTEDSWDAERVREAVRAIVANSEAAFDPDDLWPTDERDLAYSEPPVKDLYTGAAGVAFALDALRRRGYADVGIDLAGATLRALELWQHAPDYADYAAKPTTSDSSLLCGEAGVLMVAFRLAPSDELADRLFARVRENVHNEANDRRPSSSAPNRKRPRSPNRSSNPRPARRCAI